MKHVSLSDLPTQGVSHNPEIKKKVMLGSDDLPHLTTFAQARFAPGQAADRHKHDDMAEVFLIESGACKLILNGDTELVLAPGVCIAVEPGEYHELINTGSAELVITYFGLRVP